MGELIDRYKERLRGVVPGGAKVLDSEIAFLAKYESRKWRPRIEEMIREGELLSAGEGPYYVETRRPFVQIADYPQVTIATTSVSLLPLNGTGFMYPGSYWDVGKEIRFTLFGRWTTGTTPGNLTTEIRAEAAQPITNAGGVILATSAAVALTASKSAISFLLWGRVHSRVAPGTSVQALFAWATFMPDQVGLLIPAANNPQMIPAATAVIGPALNTTLAGGVSIQQKRSGSTSELVTVHDLSVEATT